MGLSIAIRRSGGGRSSGIAVTTRESARRLVEVTVLSLGDTTLDPVFRVPHVDYFDLDASYAFSAGPLQGLELRAGVENLTGEDPPIFPSIVQANTDPSQYDVFGRRYYASLRYSF